MRLELSSLKSTIARRLFFLFLIVILLPLAFTGFSAYQQMTKLIEEEHEESLTRTSTEYGLGMFERLKRAQTYLRIGIDELSSQASLNKEAQRLLHAYFNDIQLLKNGEILNTPISSPPHLPVIQQVLKSPASRLIFHEESDRKSVVLIEKLEFKSIEYTAIGTINPETIWPDTELGAYEQICIGSQSVGVFHCSEDTIPGSVLEKILLNKSRETTYWSNNTTEMISASWNLFMDYQFGTKDWVIITSKPEAVVMEKLTGFSASFISGLVLALLLIVFVTLITLRNHLKPVETLIKGTKEIANNNLKHKVIINTGDEYEDLAQSFNTMTSNLNSEFEINQALTAVDQKALLKADLGSFLQTVFEGLPLVISVQHAAVFVFDKYLTQDNTYYLYNYTDNNQSSIYKDIKSALLLVRQLIDDKPTALRPQDLYALLPDEIIRSDLHYAIYPVRQDKKLMAVLITGCNNKECHYRLEEYLNHTKIVLNTLYRERMLEVQANFDKLTGLHSRSYFQHYVNKHLEDLTTYKAGSSLQFIDLDKFKDVNDTLGHHVGDQLLTMVAKRITNLLPEEATAARFGGDEFVIFIESLEQSEVETLANTLVSNLSQPYKIGNYTAYVSASIGIALYPDHTSSFDGLLQCADMAMYRAKELGREQYQFYSESLSKEIQRRKDIENYLRNVIEDNHLELVFQPKLNIQKCKLSGFEVLSRFKHPKSGYLNPFDMYQFAEDTGQTVELGNHVMYQAMFQQVQWHEQGLWPESARMAINVSPTQLLEADFFDSLRSMMRESKAEPRHLELEITEGVFIDDPDRVKTLLDQIRQLGITIAIDDFGTGYSSLSYITELPIDNLKIDRAFILKLDEDIKYEGVLCNMVQMAKHLDFKVTAEGIEETQHLKFLHDNSCDDIQGYLFSKPLPAHQATAFLQSSPVDEFKRNTCL